MFLSYAKLRPTLLVAGLALVLGGCNIFEPFYGEGNANNVEDLMYDARIALQNNDAAGAVVYLERALALEPDNPEVRITLGQALLQRDDVSVLQLQQVAEFLGNNASGTITGSIQSVRMDVCNFNDISTAYPVINLGAEDGFVRLELSINVLRRVLNLFEGLDVAALDKELAAQGYLIRAFTSISIAIIDMKRQSDATLTSFHRLGDGSIGYCSATSENLLTLLAFIRCDQIAFFNSAIQDLQRRLALLNGGNGSLAEEILDLIADARNQISSSINVACTL